MQMRSHHTIKRPDEAPCGGVAGRPEKGHDDYQMIVVSPEPSRGSVGRGETPRAGTDVSPGRGAMGLVRSASSRWLKTSVPCVVPAVANTLCTATGVRLRPAPFAPEQVPQRTAEG